MERDMSSKNARLCHLQKALDKLTANKKSCRLGCNRITLAREQLLISNDGSMLRSESARAVHWNQQHRQRRPTSIIIVGRLTLISVDGLHQHSLSDYGAV